MSRSTSNWLTKRWTLTSPGVRNAPECGTPTTAGRALPESTLRARSRPTELRSIERYLVLEKARFGDRLQVTLRVAPEVLPVVVPFLSLQPLVENAVRHGLEDKAGTGRITIIGEDHDTEVEGLVHRYPDRVLFVVSFVVLKIRLVTKAGFEAKKQQQNNDASNNMLMSALQETLYAMGRAVLEAHDDIESIGFSAPNKHHFLVDLEPFGLDNPGEVFYVADRPYGLIEGTVLADDATPDPEAW